MLRWTASSADAERSRALPLSERIPGTIPLSLNRSATPAPGSMGTRACLQTWAYALARLSWQEYTALRRIKGQPVCPPSPRFPPACW